MSSNLYLISSDLSEIWEADLTERYSRDTEIEVTDAPVESGAEITRFATEKPDKFAVSVLVTATPWDTGLDDTRPGTLDDQLRAIARKRQPISMVAGPWTSEIMILKVGAARDAKDGNGLRVAVECKTVKTVQPKLTKIPPSRLKAKVRKQASQAKKGGHAAGKKDQSLLAKGDDLTGGRISGSLGSFFGG